MQIHKPMHLVLDELYQCSSCMIFLGVKTNQNTNSTTHLEIFMLHFFKNPKGITLTILQKKTTKKQQLENKERMQVRGLIDVIVSYCPTQMCSRKWVQN